MSKPVLLDFFAEWCGPCKRQGPILHDLKARMGDKIEVRTIDVDQHMEEATRYGIRVVPTLIIEKDGKVLRSFEGVTSLETLVATLTPLVE